MSLLAGQTKGFDFFKKLLWLFYLCYAACPCWKFKFLLGHIFTGVAGILFYTILIYFGEFIFSSMGTCVPYYTHRKNVKSFPR